MPLPTTSNGVLDCKRFPGNMPKNINLDNLDTTEYCIEIDNIVRINRTSHNFYNGCYIMNECQSFAAPTYKIINNELIKHHENKTFAQRTWYDIDYNNSAVVLGLFNELKQLIQKYN